MSRRFDGKSNIGSTKFGDLRDYLSAYYEEARRKNPNFSLRAFARYIGVDQSHLSKILNRTAKFTPRMIHKIAGNLGLSSRATRQFVKAEIVEKTQSSGYTHLSESLFFLLSDWKHFAVIELMQLPDFKSDTKWVANRLGLPVSTVNSIVSKLTRLGFITVTKGKWELKTQHHAWGHDEITSEAKRNYQVNLLREAIRSVNNLDVSVRDNSSLMIAVDRRLLPEIKERIQEFKDGLRELIEENGNYNEVYNFSISLFPLTEVKGS